MRLTTEYHMTCPCGAGIVTRQLGSVVCLKCGRAGTCTMEPLTLAPRRRSTVAGALTSCYRDRCHRAEEIESSEARLRAHGHQSTESIGYK